ncbi:flagellin N-terminal helical domain-containing protein [Paenibacillus sp. FSL P4-0184]|uniref:flagellin N-terminal helical domain-containing protein n=1 Tax=Paenibacillus sp. FSL P4-0184 TaxID=2921632 RepID=UPI0030F9B298
MIINHNIAALNTHRQLGANTAATSKNIEKLSSGLRINRAGDDAAGLAISEKMRGQIRGLDQASRNSQDGISLIQTAEGALNETHSILQRMRELAVQSGNDTNTLDDRKEIQKEVEQLKSEINRISNTTEFNTQKLLNGSLGVTGTTTDKTKVDITSATGLAKGDYTVTINTAATKASAAAGTEDFTNPTDVSAKELVINGTKIDFSGMKTATQADIVAKINEYKDVTGVSATAGASGVVKLDQSQFGSTSKIALGGADAAEFGQAITAGVDAVATVVGPNGASEQVKGIGQSVGFHGAEFVAKGVANDAATITVAGGGATLQIGANKDQSMTIDVNEVSSNTLGDKANNSLVKDVSLLTQSGSNDALKVLDEAMKQVSGERSKLGAFQNRLEHTINNLGASSENLTAAESRVRDVDMAKEMMNQTKNNILAQAAQAMLAQANQQPQGVLQLLR